MKRGSIHIITAFLVALMVTSCAVKKNNAATRSYHYTKAKYNVNFNGKQAFIKGEDAIHKASITLDNYNDILPIFEIANTQAASAASGDMDRVMEKCQKAIQLHSIVKKPKKNPKKAKDPKYKAFMAKEEYNSQVQEAMLLLGKAQYYKLDMAAAEATFIYAMRHYSDNKDVATGAALWAAKGYSQQGWYYDAEDVLNRLSEKSFSKKTTQEYVLVKADLLLRQGQYEEALPYLKNAIEITKGRTRKRVKFIYAQVLEKVGRYGEAYTAYEEATKHSPDNVMEFNAVLGMAKCYQGTSMEPIHKQTDKMLKKASNQQYLDRIYTVIGQLYERKGNKAKAIEYYKLAIEKSTRGGIDKAQALLALGEIYYNDEMYLEAQPLYSEAVTILPNTYNNYREIKSRSTNLDRVAQYTGVVTLQDSLQALAAMPTDARIKKVKETIERIHKEEAEAQAKLEEEARLAEAREKSEMMAHNNIALGEQFDRSWYFYNSALISKGKLEFQKVWGGRILEDDWRRANKVVNTFFNADVAEDMEGSGQQDESQDTEGRKLPEGFQSTGDSELDSYLLTIPTTDAQIEASNNAIEEALYDLYVVYDRSINNQPKATDTYNELLRRFPKTEYGQIKAAVSDTVEKRAEQLYVEAYDAFKTGNTRVVLANTAKAEQCCADSKLMPKFYFIEALSTGRQDGESKFKQKLTAIVEKYPDSEITPLARDMIALVGQGKEIVSGTPAVATSLMQHRESVVVTQQEYAEALEKAGFEYNPDDEHMYIVIVEGTADDKNKVLFALAQYNFTRFMIKDYDFKVKSLSDSLFAVSVTPMSSLSEAVWYQNSVDADANVMQVLKNLNYKSFVISAGNFVKVYDSESLAKYLDFYTEHNLVIKEPELLQKLQQESGFVE